MADVKPHAPDYAQLRVIMQKETGRKVTIMEAQKLGQFLLRLTRNL